MERRTKWIAWCLLPLMAGCIGDPDPTGPAPDVGAGGDAAANGSQGPGGSSAPSIRFDEGVAPFDARARIVNGSIELDVPVDVVLVGFPEATATDLSMDLAPNRIHQVLASSTRFMGSQAAFLRDPIIPTAVYRVHHLASATSTAFPDGIPRVGDFLDGNAAESWLATELEQAGIVPDPMRPALVLVHQGDAASPYRYQYANGVRENVRIFGGTLPLIVADVSAPADPVVRTETTYTNPVPVDAVASLADLVRDATSYRLLQGGLYPPSLGACHAVTAVIAHRTTAATDMATRGPEDRVDAAALAAAFAGLTGDTVHVDAVFLELPVDDPALDAVTRTVTTGFLLGGIAPHLVALTSLGITAIREWVEMNWETYHVDHPGCEEYLSLQIVGDMADLAEHGIALYDVGSGHRFNYGLVPENCRAFHELGIGQGPLCISRSGIDAFAWTQLLLLHETGHLLGLPHPHNILEADGLATNSAFGAVRTSMSYHTQDRELGFGTIDVANWNRNRAALAVAQADADGALDDDARDAALEALGRFAWQEAARIVQASTQMS